MCTDLHEPGPAGRGGVQRVLDADALVGGPHATVPADLDTALHGVSDFTETRLMLRCGVSGRVPLRPTLQQAVTTICSSSRRRVPRPLWLRACDMFVQFMAGMTPADCAASTGVCPPARVPAGGAQAHAVSSCPRCCVIVQILQTLREQMQAAMAVRVRPRHLASYAFCAVPSRYRPSSPDCCLQP